jgi:hypothetical protein
MDGILGGDQLRFEDIHGLSAEAALSWLQAISQYSAPAAKNLYGKAKRPPNKSLRQAELRRIFAAVFGSEGEAAGTFWWVCGTGVNAGMFERVEGEAGQV